MESNSPRAIHALSPQFKQNQPQRGHQRQSDQLGLQKQLISIEDIGLYEENQTINSPKSLYACRQEGIFPKELLFKPLQSYEDPKKRLPPEIVKMRFDFFESKRLEMINTVKRARQRLIDDIRSPSAMTQRLRQQSLQKGFETTRDSLAAGASTQQSTSRIFGNANVRTGLATSRSQADLSSLAVSQSKILQGSASSVVDQANQRDRELFQKQMELAERTRLKEAKMVEMMIKNEEAKNNKIEENQRKFEDLMMREKNRNRHIQQRLKEEAERKYQEEMHRTREESQREKSEKRNQWETFLQKLEIQKEEEKIQDFKKEMRKQIIQEREKLRQEKFRICQERNEQMMEQTRMKIQIAQTKYSMMLHKLEERKKQFQQSQKIKKQEKELFKHKVFENLQRQEEEKERSWVRKQEQEREKEKKMKREKERQLKEQLLKAQMQDKKIQETLLVSERREQERKDILMHKQQEASERLERQRQRQKFEELMKKEMFNLKNLSKDFNRQRATRKNEFVKEQMMEKLESDRVRYEAMTTERSHLKAVRIQTLVESEIQRENIRNALYQMSVWNTFDPKVIFHIMGQEKQHEGKGIGGGDLTVEELVRKSAISAQRQRKINRHQFSSSQGFQSMKSLSQPSTNAFSQENVDNMGQLKIHVGTPNTNLFGFVSPAKTVSNFYPDDAHSQQLEPNSPHLNETPQLQKDLHSQQVSFVNQSQSQLVFNEENSNSQQVLNGSSFSKPQNTQVLTTAHENDVSRLHPNLYAAQFVEDSMIHQTKPGDQNSYFKDGQMISGINQSCAASQGEDLEQEQAPEISEPALADESNKKKKIKKKKKSQAEQSIPQQDDVKQIKKPKNRETAKFFDNHQIQQLTENQEEQTQRQEFHDDNYDYGEEKNFIQDDDQD